MSVETQAAASAAATDTSTQTPTTMAPAVPAAAPSQPAAATPPAEPEWLAPRLERAKRIGADEALKSVGFASADEAKAARDLLEAQKTETQKLREKAAQLEPEAKAAGELKQRLERFADSELAKLSDAQRAAVMAVAGDDKTKALDVIEKLRPTWNVPAAPTAATAPATPPAAPMPIAASTAPGPSAPAATPPQTVNREAEWRALRAVNPFKAAEYANQHAAEILRDSESKSR